MIRIEPPEDYAPLDAACRDVGGLRLHRLFQRERRRLVHASGCSRARCDLRELKGVKLCAVGPATAERLTRHGLKIDVDAGGVPGRRRWSHAISEAGNVRGLRVLLPHADIGREIVADELAQAGRRRDRGRRLSDGRRRPGA